MTDYFFTDYKWNENMLSKSFNNAGNRNNDVFAGIDVLILMQIFGRGAFKGGQWNVKDGIIECKKQNLSCALFAIGWLFENN